MRKTFETQLEIGSTPIEKIEWDTHCRDDVTAVLRGLQELYQHVPTRNRIFALLEIHVQPEVSRHRGRPGMSLWQIFVLAILQKALDCDFDRLTNLANSHKEVRQMLGHGDFGPGPRYRVQTVMDNVQLLTQAALEEINAVVVSRGHTLLGHKPSDTLRCRVDSAVAKTHVEWPTDVRLLCDAVRRLTQELARLCVKHAIAGWRKVGFWLDKLRRAFNQIRSMRKGRAKKSRVAAFLSLCRAILAKATDTFALLGQQQISCKKTLLWYFEAGMRLLDQVDRRLIKGEKIPHEEKIFSIHEPHTRWINKGKAGVPAELGVPVCVLEDQHQFILSHQVMHEGGDSDMIVPFVDEVQARYPTFQSCSVDKGFYTPANRAALDERLTVNAMPKKGGLNAADRARETAPVFKEARRQHPAMESAIHNLQVRGLSLVRTHGKEGFDRTVAQAVVATNVHRLGQVLKQHEKRRARWYKSRQRVL